MNVFVGAFAKEISRITVNKVQQLIEYRNQNSIRAVAAKMLKAFCLIISLVSATDAFHVFAFSPSCDSLQRRSKAIIMKNSSRDRKLRAAGKDMTDFSNVPTRGVISQKSMLTRGVGFVGALIASGLMTAPSSRAADLCTKCGTPGCESPLCDKSGSISEAWYNPDNERIFDTYHKSYLPARPELYLSKDRLEGRKIIAIGETHTNPLCHRLELDVIRALAINNVQKGQQMAIGLECFFRQHQAALDRFVFSHHDLAVLKAETDWEKSWGYDLNYYAKIFNFASVHGIRLIGLNIPYPVAQLVGEVGLANVPSKLRNLLPNIDLGVVKHREQFEAAIGAFGGHGTMSSDAFNRMYEVQTLWDEYMAESAAMYSDNNPDDLLVVIAGVGHVAGRVGIPDRISRRVKEEPFVIVPQSVDWIASSGLPDVALPPTSDDCDWALYTERELAV